jgi:ABC-2 type transport system ATP-binding protein
MIEISGIKKFYSKVVALNGLDLKLEPGDFCALIGANGAGKSTLLRVLSNLEHPNGGVCKFDGVDICDDDIKLKEKIAYIDENINFHFNSSVEDFLKYYKSFYKKWDDSLLQYLFKNKFLNKNANFTELSRGQKMQLVLAAAIARQPKYILIDEVTAVMDVFIRKFFVDYLKKYAVKNDAIVVIATNIITEVDFVANKLLVLNFGEISLFDNYENIRSNFIKIRKGKGDKSPIFKHKECIWLQRNSDGSSSYIMKKETLESMSNEGVLEDKREVLIHEIFSYYNSILRGEDVKGAA